MSSCRHVVEVKRSIILSNARICRSGVPLKVKDPQALHILQYWKDEAQTLAQGALRIVTAT